MATRKKHTPNVGWNPQSPPGMHKATRNLRELLKMKKPEDFPSLKSQKKAQEAQKVKMASKVKSQVGPGKKTGQAVSAPQQITSVKEFVKSQLEKNPKITEKELLEEVNSSNTTPPKPKSEDFLTEEESKILEVEKSKVSFERVKEDLKKEEKPKKKRGRPRKKKSEKKKASKKSKKE
jgi:hypothetical protein